MTTESTDAFADDLRAQFADKENVRPETLAAALQLANGKALRGFLRMTYPRPIESKGSTWLLTNEQALATLEHFLAKRVTNATAAE